MPDFTEPKIRLHTVNIREQFVAPLMDGRLKAITRLNGRGYNTGDYLRFSVLPMQSSDVQFSMTTDGERDALHYRFYEITFAMYVGIERICEFLPIPCCSFDFGSNGIQRSLVTDKFQGERHIALLQALTVHLFDTAYPEGYDSQYTKRHAEPSLDSIAKVATEAASDAERPLSC